MEQQMPVQRGFFKEYPLYDVTALTQYDHDTLLQVFTADTFTSTQGVVLPYRLYLPDGFTADGTVPLFVYLHGGGLRGNDNLLQMTGGDMYIKYALLQRQKKERCAILIPQCPLPGFWSASMTYDGKYHVNITDTNQSDVIDAVYQLVVHTAEKLGADMRRLYLHGVSMGGMGSYDLLYRHTQLFAAAIIGCAASDPSKASVIGQTPLYLLHGAHDEVVQTEGSRNMAKALKEVGAEFIYTETDVPGHAFFTEFGQYAESLDWAFAHRR